jgi:hypothetical protein
MMSNSLVNKPAAKNLGDLFKMPSNALMLAILRAVDSQQAHKSTGRNQSVSVLFLFFFWFIYYLISNVRLFYLSGTLEKCP